VSLAKLSKSSITLATGLGVGTGPLRVEIPAVQFSVSQSLDGFVNGIVGISVAVTQIVLASAVEVKRRESCHGGNAKEKLAPRETNICVKGALRPLCSHFFTNGFDQLLLCHSLAIDFPHCAVAPLSVFHISRDDPTSYFFTIEFSMGECTSGTAIFAALNKSLIVKLASEYIGISPKIRSAHC